MGTSSGIVPLHCTAWQCWFNTHATFYRFKESSSYWSVKRILVFLCFSLLNQRHNFGITVYNCTVTNIENHATFYRFKESSSYWSVKRILVFLCFSLLNQRHTFGITVCDCTITNIENTVRAVHSCTSWFNFILPLFSSFVIGLGGGREGGGWVGAYS